MLACENLVAEAKRLSGIDMDDSEVREPLAVLVAALNGEAHLSRSGETAMVRRLTRLLANRLRMERDLAAHPEIHDIVIRAPVFIFGLPRSGTTKLQKLLSESSGSTSLPLWMAHNPSLLTGERNEPSAPRIEDTRRYVEWLDRVNPGVRLVHAFDIHEPEEVNPILEQAFLSAYVPAFVEVPSYIGWYAAQDPRKSLVYLKRVLQYLQWQFDIDGAKPWVLKNPTFLGMESAIRDIFPSARFVMTHRHPAAIISSSASLIVEFHKLYSDIDVHATAGIMMAEGQAMVMQQHLRNRAEMPDLDIIDIGYSELAADGLATMERLHARLAIPFSASSRANIAAWEQTHYQHKFGIHRHSLDSFGLSTEAIEEKFAAYIARFAGCF